MTALPAPLDGRPVQALLRDGSGAMWVGMMAFMTFYLTPALNEVGPDAGKVMQALQKQKIMIVMPVIALLTIISGGWMISMPRRPPLITQHSNII